MFFTIPAYCSTLLNCLGQFLLGFKNQKVIFHLHRRHDFVVKNTHNSNFCSCRSASSNMQYRNQEVSSVWRRTLQVELSATFPSKTQIFNLIKIQKTYAHDKFLFSFEKSFLCVSHTWQSIELKWTGGFKGFYGHSGGHFLCGCILNFIIFLFLK